MAAFRCKHCHATIISAERKAENAFSVGGRAINNIGVEAGKTDQTDFLAGIIRKHARDGVLGKHRRRDEHDYIYEQCFFQVYFLFGFAEKSMKIDICFLNVET